MVIEKENLPPVFLKMLVLTRGVKSDIEELKKEGTYILSLQRGVQTLLKFSTVDVAPLSLTRNGNEFFVESSNIKQKVEIITPEIEHALEDYLILSGKSLFIFPFGNARSLFTIHRDYRAIKSRNALNVDDFIERVTPLFKKNKIDTIFICNFQKSDDGGVFPLHNYIRFISKNFKGLVGTIVNHPEKTEWIDWTYAVGVDLIWYELFCFNKNLHKKIFSELDYDLTIKSLIHATTVSPVGCVFTTLVAGIEPEEDTLKGIEFLTEKGIIPLISINPGYNISVKSLLNIYEHLIRALEKHKIKSNSITTLYHIITPYEFLRHYSKMAANRGVLSRLLPERLIGSAVRNIYRIRRNLRVRETR